MKARRVQAIGAAVVGLAVLVAFQNCGEVQFSSKTTDSLALGRPEEPKGPSSENPPVICDPFAASNNIDPKLGIEGTLHYTANRIQAGDCSSNKCTSRDYIAQGTVVDARLFMSQIFVPTRAFSEGFDVQGYGKLRNQAGQDLVEWFALDLKSNITLSASDDEGMYQFGAISDDGVTLNSQDNVLLVDEGEHAPRLSCSPQVVPLKKGNLLPFRFTYFQGPRQQIALILMWRRMDGQSLTDCGSSDGYIADQAKLPSALTNRGWKVLKPENFKLSDGYNLCTSQKN